MDREGERASQRAASARATGVASPRSRAAVLAPAGGAAAEAAAAVLARAPPMGDVALEVDLPEAAYFCVSKARAALSAIDVNPDP